MKPISKWFYFACAAESSLVLAATGLGYFFHHVPWANCRWNLADGLAGLGAAIPPFLFFVAMLRSPPAYLQDVRRALEQTVRPLFEGWSVFQLAVISMLAGVSEELLFRGLLQEKLAGLLGPIWSLTVASLLFGCVHPITVNYAIVTGGIGVYLGGLMLATGNLLAPIVTHAAYDFAALIYFLRAPQRRPLDSVLL